MPLDAASSLVAPLSMSSWEFEVGESRGLVFLRGFGGGVPSRDSSGMIRGCVPPAWCDLVSHPCCSLHCPLTCAQLDLGSDSLGFGLFQPYLSSLRGLSCSSVGSPRILGAGERVTPIHVYRGGVLGCLNSHLDRVGQREASF